MKKINTSLILLFSLASVNCFRLDSFFYSPNTDITEYKMDNYDKKEFILDSSYNIDPSMVSIFTITSADDEGKPVEIYAMYLGDISRISSDKVVLYCHGNSGNMDYYWLRVKLLANMNGQHFYGLLTFDYQGYGLSKGTPSEENLYRDTDAAMSWLKNNGLTDDRLIIYGYSMGTDPCHEFNGKPRAMQPALLILESPFASADIMVQDGSGLALPGSYFTNQKIFRLISI